MTELIARLRDRARLIRALWQADEPLSADEGAQQPVKLSEADDLEAAADALERRPDELQQARDAILAASDYLPKRPFAALAALSKLAARERARRWRATGFPPTTGGF